MKEDYPASFSMEEFKKLTSFAKRIAYCEEHLQRISSGSSRIVYKIDDVDNFDEAALNPIDGSLGAVLPVQPVLIDQIYCHTYSNN